MTFDEALNTNLDAGHVRVRGQGQREHVREA